ncbi:MAG: hypothetical protein Q8R30_03370 [bacterium]|nr:hypothetical protein [bacterium]MDZ4260679.1 hypothetical protein [Candidatus Sungbacteria bacterium]
MGKIKEHFKKRTQYHQEHGYLAMLPDTLKSDNLLLELENLIPSHLERWWYTSGYNVVLALLADGHLFSNFKYRAPYTPENGKLEEQALIELIRDAWKDYVTVDFTKDPEPGFDFTIHWQAI